MAVEFWSREEARAVGVKRFYTGIPCRNGHDSARQVSTGNCVACVYARTKRWRADGNRRSAEEGRLYRIAHPEVGKRASLAYRKRNLERVQEQQRLSKRAWREQNPSEQKAVEARVRSRRLAKQEAVAGRSRPPLCEVCSETSGLGIVFDHDHGTGAFRGWICDRCNKTLGHVKDDPELLRKLADYLEANSGQSDRRAA